MDSQTIKNQSLHNFVKHTFSYFFYTVFHAQSKYYAYTMQRNLATFP